MKANFEVRELIEKKRLKHYEVAQEMGIYPGTLSRWLRTEMSEERKKQVLNAINKLI